MQAKYKFDFTYISPKFLEKIMEAMWIDDGCARFWTVARAQAKRLPPHAKVD